MSIVRCVLQHAGRRGAFLGFLAILDLAYGYSLFSFPRAALQGINIGIPIEAWGWIWIVTGLVCATGIFLRSDRVQYTFAALLKTAWGFLWAWLWWQGEPNSWASVAVWLSFAMTIVLIAGWPEHRRVHRTPEGMTT
jgi:hypothetical protein